MPTKGKTPVATTADVVHLDWLGNLRENRGLDLPSKLITGVDIAPRSRESQAMWESGDVAHPLPNYFDRIAAVEFSEERIVEDLKEGFDVLKDKSVNLADDDNEWAMDPAWVASSPADASDALQLLAAQRDAAISVLDNLREATHIQAQAFQIALARVRELEARPQGGDHEAGMASAIADLTARIGELQGELAESNQTMVDLARKNLRRKASEPEEARHHREAAEPVRVEVREDTPRTDLSAASNLSGKRSAKVPDPPVFYNEKDRDSQLFEQWLDAIEDKLEINADHFPTDRARMAYIKSRMGGVSAAELAPYLRSSHPEQIVTLDRLLEHLREQYSDPNRAEQAIDDFRKLEMAPGDDFLAFKNKFVRLAGECGEPRTKWKPEFKRRIPAAMQRALARDYLNPNVTFEEYTRLGAEIALINRQANEKSGRRLNNPKLRSGPSGARQSNPRSGGNKNGDNDKKGNPGPRPTKDEIRILIQEGRCFICREKGHTTRDCPKKGGRLGEEEIKALADKMALKWGDGKKAAGDLAKALQESRFEELSDSEN